jgi:hypothetical protein
MSSISVNVWIFIAAVIVVLIWNGIRRVRWNIAWNAAGNGAITIPEGRWSYDAHDLEQFAEAGRTGNLLQRYRQILLSSDIAFAVALSAITVFICYKIAVTPMPCAAINWAALPLGAMAILYGVADVAEDVKLAAILRHPHAIDHAEAAATNMLTRIKMVTLTLSLIGAAIFVVVIVLETIAIRAGSRQPAPA